MIRRALAPLAALAAAGALFLAPAASAAVTPAGGVALWNRPVCGAEYVPIDMGAGDYFNVYNEQDGRSCVSAEEHHLSFEVTSRGGSVKGWQYPNISSGWEWGRYTCADGRSAYPASPGSQCMRYPVQEKADGTPLTSVTYFPHLAAGNVSYDIWFNRTDSAPGQDDGTEVMIWLAHPGVSIPARSVCWDATIGGVKYEAMCWTARNGATSWNYVAYVAVRQTATLPPTWLNGFFRNAISHGKLSPDWWLTGIDFGSEMNSGGTGFAVKTYMLKDVR